MKISKPSPTKHVRLIEIGFLNLNGGECHKAIKHIQKPFAELIENSKFLKQFYVGKKPMNVPKASITELELDQKNTITQKQKL